LFTVVLTRGFHPLRRPVPGNLYHSSHSVKLFTRLQFRDMTASDFKLELFPLHSQLLRKSRLVSFPLLINMLKFSRCSHLIRGRRFVEKNPDILVLFFTHAKKITHMRFFCLESFLFWKSTGFKVFLSPNRCFTLFFKPAQNKFVTDSPLSLNGTFCKII